MTTLSSCQSNCVSLYWEQFTQPSRTSDQPSTSHIAKHGCKVGTPGTGSILWYARIVLSVSYSIYLLSYILTPCSPFQLAEAWSNCEIWGCRRRKFLCRRRDEFSPSMKGATRSQCPRGLRRKPRTLWSSNPPKVRESLCIDSKLVWFVEVHR